MSVNLPALTPQPPPTANPARDPQSAVRAFFQAATSAVAPTPAAAAPTAPRVAPVIDPERPLRPGSLLDIRI